LTEYRGRARIWVAALFFAQSLWAQDLKQFEKKVTEFTLANGLHFILVERHEAPVVSFRTWVDAGSSEDPANQTGLAHLVERMGYKGTETFGTSDWVAEKKALDVVEEAADKLQEERNKGPRAAADRLELLRLDLDSAMDRAAAYSHPGEYTAFMQSSGADGLNSATAFDHTEFSCNLPSNRIELWFLMESQRLLTPVFRAFYGERDAALSEERTTVGNNSLGMMVRDLVATAFPTGPYHNPSIGWPSDIAGLRTREARGFYEKYYVPSNMVMTIVGDINPDECRKMAERYFGPLPSRPSPPKLSDSETAQLGPRTFELDVPTQPVVGVGFRRPSDKSPDAPVFTIINLILTGGHTGLLYKELVEKQRLAVEARGVSAYPASRFPCLFAIMVLPAKDRPHQDVEKALETALTGLTTQRVDDEMLNRARTMARVGFIHELETNAGISATLPAYYMAYGDWRELFTAMADVQKVTADDVLRVAHRYLVASQRTTGFVVAASPQAAGGGR
jgi:predicted Zn-dependent peptidase